MDKEYAIARSRQVKARTNAIIAALPERMQRLFRKEDTSRCSSKYQIYRSVVFELVDGAYLEGFYSGEDQFKPESAGRRAGRALNHDLLERALSILIRETQTSVAAYCCVDRTGSTTAPIPGTCPHEAAEELEEQLQIIRDIESEIGPTAEPEADWFADLVDRRWSLTGKADVP